jgi:hypothetical protein
MARLTERSAAAGLLQAGGVDMGNEIEEVNPYHPPERQRLEHQLEDDTRLQHTVHDTIQQEQHLSDQAQAAGWHTPETGARIQRLEHAEQTAGQAVVEDQQDISHWDHAHPGWEDHVDQYYQPDSQSTEYQETGNPWVDTMLDDDEED